MSAQKRPETTSKALIEAELDKYGAALLKVAYGHIVEPPDGGAISNPEVNPAMFKAVVDWIRVKNKLEPDGSEQSGIDKLRNRFTK
ncbi:MAG: hypothetical protein KGL39_44000 [Patescibacteria group bacterium]|nr:hypothetical protein [Patescibacteria group bacterium]